MNIQPSLQHARTAGLAKSSSIRSVWDVQLQRKVSLKLFRDGKVQLAGCLSEADAVTAAQILIVHLMSVRDVSKQGTMRIHMTKPEQAELVAAVEDNDAEFRELLHKFSAIDPWPLSKDRPRTLVHVLYED